jgi:hypothetical protein
LHKKEKVSSVLVDMLQDEASWIFLPEQMQVYYYNEKQNSFVLLTKELLSFEQQSTKTTVSKIIHFQQEIVTDKLQLVLFPLKDIPDWHTAKGNHAWLFIDELKVY